MGRFMGTSGFEDVHGAQCLHCAVEHVLSDLTWWEICGAFHQIPIGIARSTQETWASGHRSKE